MQHRNSTPPTLQNLGIMDRPLVVGKGSAVKSKTQKGVFYIRHNMGKDPVTGKYAYSPRRKVYARNKSELRAALEAYKAELNEGVVVKKSSQTVGEYAQLFHDTRKNELSPLSYDREQLEINEIKELFGNYPIRDLRAPVIKQAYVDVRKTARFSESELHKIHVKLKQIMKAALVDELILKNPCDAISVPRPQGAERQSLRLDEAKKLLETLLSQEMDAHRIGMLLLLDTGMRRGELLGLSWSNVHLDDGYIFVGEQFAADKNPRAPKSAKGLRSISLSPFMNDRLSAWKMLQGTLLSEVGLEQDSSTPVVHALRDARKKGRATMKSERRKCNPIEIVHMDPNNFGRWFREWSSDYGFGKFTEITHYVERDGVRYARGKGYTGLTPHILRHTQATLLIGENVDIKTVSSRLGHSTVKLTLDTYSHAIAAKDKAAADTIGSLLSH